MKLILGNTTECLEKAREALRKWLKKKKIWDKLSNRIVLALDEALTNIISHGFKYQKEGFVNVEFLRENNKIYLIIEDNGKYYDITKVKPPAPITLMKKGKTHGFGIYIIKTIMDEVKYIHSEKEGTNKLILIKYIK